MKQFGTIGRSKTNERMRLAIAAAVGIIFGFWIGISFPVVSITKLTFPSSIISYIEDRNSGITTQALLNHAWTNTQNRSSSSKSNSTFQIYVPTNPRGAERLPPDIIVPESDLYLRRLWGKPSEDLQIKQKYLVTFTVGYAMKNNVDAAVKKVSWCLFGSSNVHMVKHVIHPSVDKLRDGILVMSKPVSSIELSEAIMFMNEFSANFTILLFHYDGRVSEWDEFEWSKRAIHVSAKKQTKWWYAKRFLHPDIVARYEYIFIWDEDLGVEHFNGEKYVELVNKHRLEISQPGLEPRRGLTWQMTKRRADREVHKETEERPGWCSDPHMPPCAAFVEIMAPVFSRDAWRCVWHVIQNDLVHGWGLDFALRRCAEPAHERIGVVDAQWIVHLGVPSLGNQGEKQEGKAPWQGVRERCRKEWAMFQTRLADADKAHYKKMGITPPNSTLFS